MKKIILAVLILGGSLVPVEARGPQIPEHLLKEGKEIYAQYEANPSSNRALFNLAMYYGYTGQVEAGWGILQQISPDYSDTVVAEYEAKINENPSEWRYPFKLAFGYYFQDRKKESIKQFERVLELDPQNAWVIGYRALVMGDLGFVDEAVRETKRAIKMQPKSPALHLLLAEGYRRQGNYFGAMAEMMVVGRLKTEQSVKKRRFNDDLY